ncbi:hypothetical protein IVB43_23910 [Bradyrhizobium sp. 48]|nr:hypothetical protein [Bradyrhizobium sp. 48]MCK1445435.1 hypothetical protein [Bradyrhizobium sp. 48]
MEAVNSFYRFSEPVSIQIHVTIGLIALFALINIALVVRERRSRNK